MKCDGGQLMIIAHPAVATSRQAEGGFDPSSDERQAPLVRCYKKRNRDPQMRREG